MSDERGTYNDERKSSERRGFVTRNGNRLKDVNTNSRGLLSPRFYDGIHIYIWRLEDANRQPGVIKLYLFYAHRSMLKTVAVPRLYRRRSE